ncbi:hypothetical protein BLA50215_07486 [Burkholderia lata]|uniref:hypothetical protein n=1 Tax=Burkholderia lata (strain ATCC 17760 / DSM 23089 / LMG 22485 / NCIMB 9086 / R18194 / 383) TaxID=482957 RepID=UPI00145344C3|nr:hypothetical protein [Burkholderia lata]VWD61891.1 hypothetical protein BLA50215_07486 [Burkholderia lata]
MQMNAWCERHTTDVGKGRFERRADDLIDFRAAAGRLGPAAGVKHAPNLMAVCRSHGKLTGNTDKHPIMKRMRKPNNEKRSVAILRFDDHYE